MAPLKRLFQPLLVVLDLLGIYNKLRRNDEINAKKYDVILQKYRIFYFNEIWPTNAPT